MAATQQADLHASLVDPVLSIPLYHTEVMNRHPDAISFGPGAPNPKFAHEFDAPTYIERFMRHLREDRGFDEKQARSLIYDYGPSRGVINDLVAEALLRDQKISVPARAVVMTVGAQEGMLLILRVLLRDATDLVAVVNPCFIGFSGAARLLGAGLVPVNETQDGIDLDLLERTCVSTRRSGKRIRALYVAPDFSNPSGTLMGLDARRRLLEIADRHDFFVIEDTTYAFTAEPATKPPSLKALDRDARVISLNTFAKIGLPGARVGFVVADQKVESADGSVHLLADDISLAKGMVSLNTPAVSQAVVAGMLLENELSLVELGRPKAELYRDNLAFLLDSLDQELPEEHLRTWTRPGGGFFVRMTLSVEVTPKLMETSASEYGVLWTPMSQFYLDGGGKNEIRLSCSYLDHAQIKTGVSRLANFLRSR